MSCSSPFNGTQLPVLSCPAFRQDCVQVLGMLQGVQHPGAAFELDAEGRGFAVVQGVHVAHLSPTCLRKLLQRFAETGNMALM